MNIKERFEHVGFTPEEKMDLTARLERAAEQEDDMTDATKRKMKKISGGMVFGIAAAAVMTVGALAAVITPSLRDWADPPTPSTSEVLEDNSDHSEPYDDSDRSEIYNTGGHSETDHNWTVPPEESVEDNTVQSPGLRDWFDTTVPGASEALENTTYRIGRSETYNGWTVSLAECVGDDSGAYIWMDIIAPEGTVLPRPGGGNLDLPFRIEDFEGVTISSYVDEIPGDNRLSEIIQTRFNEKNLRGETVTIKVGPIVDSRWEMDPETGEWVHKEGSGLTEAIRDHEWVFEDVKLDYPNQTICLEPNVEVPWLDGATTVTKLEVSPLSIHVTVEGGSCAAFEDHTNTPFSSGGEVIISSGGLTITGGLDSNTDWFVKRQEMENKLTVELAFQDGTKLVPYNYVDVKDGYQEGIEGSETPYFSFGRMYDYTDEDMFKMVSRVVDPAQIDHVTICGVDIPLHPEQEEFPDQAE